MLQVSTRILWGRQFILDSRLRLFTYDSRFRPNNHAFWSQLNWTLNPLCFFLSPLNIPTTHAFVRRSRSSHVRLLPNIWRKVVGISMACRHLPFVSTLFMFRRTLVNNLSTMVYRRNRWKVFCSRVQLQIFMNLLQMYLVFIIFCRWQFLGI